MKIRTMFYTLLTLLMLAAIANAQMPPEDPFGGDPGTEMTEEDWQALLDETLAMFDTADAAQALEYSRIGVGSLGLQSLFLQLNAMQASTRATSEWQMLTGWAQGAVLILQDAATELANCSNSLTEAAGHIDAATIAWANSNSQEAEARLQDAMMSITMADTSVFVAQGLTTIVLNGLLDLEDPTTNLGGMLDYLVQLESS